MGVRSRNLASRRSRSRLVGALGQMKTMRKKRQPDGEEGPPEVTVAEVRVVAVDEIAETVALRFTMAEICNLGGGFDVSKVVPNGTYNPSLTETRGETGDNDMDEDGFGTFITLLFFEADASTMTSWELQADHGITSLVGPVVATASGSVIPLP